MNNKNFKIFLFTVLSFFMISLTVFANGEMYPVAFDEQITCCNEETFIKGYILHGITEEQSEISMNEFELDAHELEVLVNDVIEENTTHTTKIESFEIIDTDGNLAISIVYGNEIALFDAKQNTEIAKEKARIHALIEDDMTDLEKALVVHDYMAYNYEYDRTYSIYSAEELFEKKTGVCQAYALAYIQIMSELGIECEFVPSRKMNHAWNLVKIDGQWYHVDVTWDDPTPDLLGRVCHSFFLLSDDGIYAKDHHSWTISKSASSKKYDDYFWSDIRTQIINRDNNWYYIDYVKPYGHIIKKDVKTGVETSLYTIYDYWWVWNDYSIWMDCFSGIGMSGDKIYYNTPTQIESYNLSTGETVVEYIPDTTNGYIYAFVLDNMKITYGLSTSPNNGIESKGIWNLGLKVSFNANGGSVVQTFKEVVYNEKYGELPAPTRDGYIFKGWYTKLSGGVSITQDTIVSIAGDHTLYAQWEKEPAKIGASVKKSNNKYYIEVTPSGVDKENHIYVACFKGKSLLNAERRIYDGNLETFWLSEGTDEVKVMVWGNYVLTPKCEKVDIYKSEFEN